MPSWVRKVFIQKLPRILLMRVPIQVIKDSMGTRRSKFLRQSDPALKSLTGNEKKQIFCYLIRAMQCSSNRWSSAAFSSHQSFSWFTGEEDEELAEAEKAALNGTGKENGGGGGSSGTGKSSDFKSHLNNLYNGLAKIMSSTCQVEKEEVPKAAPFAVEKAVHNIIFIKHHMKRQDEFEAVSYATFPAWHDILFSKIVIL